MAAAMVMREADARPKSDTNTISLAETHRHRDGRPLLKQPTFNWNAPNKYKELSSFEMEVMNILETKI